MTAVGERTSAGRARHERADRDVPVQPGGDRAGLRDDGVPVPGPDRARAGHRRGAERDRGDRGGVAGLQGPVRPAARGRAADAAVVDRGPVSVRRASSTRPSTPRCTTSPSTPVPVYIAAGGPVVAKYAGRSGDGFICTSGKGMELYTDKLLPAVEEGAQAAGRDAAAIDRTIEIKMSYDRDHERALENCRFWAPLSLTAGAEAQRGLLGGDGAAGRRAADRAGRAAVDRGVGPGRGRGADQALPRRRAQPPGVPRPGPRPGAVPHPVRRRRAAEAARPGAEPARTSEAAFPQCAQPERRFLPAGDRGRLSPWS